MKKTTLILSIAAFVLSVAVAIVTLTKDGKTSDTTVVSSDEVTASAGDIVYVQIDSLIVQYDMFNDLKNEFEGKAQKVQDELNRKGRKLESDIKNFENSVQKGLMTRSAAESKQQELLKRQQDLNTLMQQKQAELLEEESVMNNQVMYAINTYLEKYNEEKKFSLIFTTSGATNTIIIGNKALNVTAEVVKGLNAEYIKKKKKK